MYTHIDGVDYTGVASVVQFGSGSGPGAVETFTFPIIDDSLVEDTETLILSATPSAPGVIADNDATATVAIQDNDSKLYLFTYIAIYSYQNENVFFFACMYSYSSITITITYSYFLFSFFLQNSV